VTGSWWPDFVAWLGARCGADRKAPGALGRSALGGGGLGPLVEAPGTYVLDRQEETTMYENIGRSLGTGYFRIGDQLTPAEREIWRRTRDFVDHEVLPVINDYWERAEFPAPLVVKLAELGIVGDGIEGYGCR